MNKFTYSLVAEIKNASLELFAEGVSDVVSALQVRYREYLESDLYKNKVARESARNDARRRTVAWTEHEIAKKVLTDGKLVRGNIIKVTGTRDGHGLRIFQGFDENDRIICTKLDQWSLDYSDKGERGDIYEFEKRLYRMGIEATTHAAGKVRKVLVGGKWAKRPYFEWDGKLIGHKQVHVLAVHRDLTKEIRK